MGSAKRRREPKPPDNITPSAPLTAFTKSTTGANLASSNQINSPSLSNPAYTYSILRFSNLTDHQIKSIEDYVEGCNKNERNELKTQYEDPETERRETSRENSYGAEDDVAETDPMVTRKNKGTRSEHESQKEYIELLESEIKDLGAKPGLVSNLKERVQKAEKMNEWFKAVVKGLRAELDYCKAKIPPAEVSECASNADDMDWLEDQAGMPF